MPGLLLLGTVLETSGDDLNARGIVVAGLLILGGGGFVLVAVCTWVVTVLQGVYAWAIDQINARQNREELIDNQKRQYDE